MCERYVILIFLLLGIRCSSILHYAEGLQHPHQGHIQFPSKKSYEGRTHYREENEGVPLGGPWTRVASKDYYKKNGYSVKSTSGIKTTIAIESPMPKDLLAVREATDHLVRMRWGTKCRTPRPEVVCVKDLYPEKEWLPRCTLLHRCTPASGCCNETSQCAPRTMQEVSLHFYILGNHKSSDVKKLLFVNHTECECRQEDQIATSQPKCRSCPVPFRVREEEDGRCSCDCFDRHKPCIRIKRGREALDDDQRRCILAGHCNIPDCDYGEFDPERGRCPRRPDNESIENNGRRPHPNSRNPNHRWTYFERD